MVAHDKASDGERGSGTLNGNEITGQRDRRLPFAKPSPALPDQKYPHPELFNAICHTLLHELQSKVVGLALIELIQRFAYPNGIRTSTSAARRA